MLLTGLENSRGDYLNRGDNTSRFRHTEFEMPIKSPVADIQQADRNTNLGL